MTHVYMFVGMPVFALDYSILPIAAAVVGGPGTLAGAALGAFILVPLSEAPAGHRRSSDRDLRGVSGGLHRGPAGRHLSLYAAQISAVRTLGRGGKMSTAPFLKPSDLSKAFGGVQAL